MEMREYVDIREHTTFKIGGQFRYFIELDDPALLKDAYGFALEKDLPLFVLGGGSNMVFPDGVFEQVVVKIEFSGFEILSETDTYIDIKIGAGENWDSVVARTVAMNLSGIEAMSAIPGTAGATPVQNVGAYGQEIKDTVREVEVFDIETKILKNLNNSQCMFTYRDSIFKHDAKGKYIITSITLRLSKLPPKTPDYPGVKKYFDEKGVTDPTLQEIREAIIQIRSIKLPDPKKIANVGSFFKNPIVNTSIAEKVKREYPLVTLFPVGGDLTKVPAGFLIETAGLKGKDFGTISTYKNNALVLVNNGGATRSDVERVKTEIVKTVHDMFGIMLEPEPEFL